MRRARTAASSVMPFRRRQKTAWFHFAQYKERQASAKSVFRPSESDNGCVSAASAGHRAQFCAEYRFCERFQLSGNLVNSRRRFCSFLLFRCRQDELVRAIGCRTVCLARLRAVGRGRVRRFSSTEHLRFVLRPPNICRQIVPLNWPIYLYFGQHCGRHIDPLTDVVTPVAAPQSDCQQKFRPRLTNRVVQAIFRRPDKE